VEKFKDVWKINDRNLFKIIQSHCSLSLMEKVLLISEPRNEKVIQRFFWKKDISQDVLNIILEMDPTKWDPTTGAFHYLKHSEQINCLMYHSFEEKVPLKVNQCLLQLGLERNYFEMFMKEILENLPEISQKQLDLAKQQRFSPEFIALMTSKLPAEWCIVS